MSNGCLRIVFLIVTSASVALAQQPSALVGTWVGKVQGYEVEMKLVLNADGTADYEGALGSWRLQGNRVLLTEEGETVAYNFTLQGSQLTLSGGDLMAPLVLTRAGGSGGAIGGGGFAPRVQAPEQAAEVEAPPPASGPGGLAGLGGMAGGKTPAASEATPRRRALAESDLVQLLESGVPSRRLIDLVEEHGVAFSPTPALTSKLKAKGATDELIAAVRRAGVAQTRGAAAATKAPAGGLAGLGQMGGAQPARGSASGGGLAGLGQAPSGPSGGVSRPSVAAGGRPPSGGGSRQNYEPWGLSFVVPPGWKVGERQGFLLMGSDTEAGLIIVRLARRATLEQLVQEYGEGMQEEGLQLMPTMQAQEFPAGQNRAVAGELAGTAQDGAQIRARTIAVASPFGDAAVVLGMTTEEKYSGLKPRVESIASSFSFTQPQAPPVLEAIAGQWFYISTSSFGSSERYLNLCSDGRFSERSDIYSSGGAGTAYGERGNTAQWSAEGDANQGTVTVTYPNGETSQFQYQRGGGGLIVDGRKYARYGDGSCTKTSPY
jgi:hypothetical protein